MNVSTVWYRIGEWAKWRKFDISLHVGLMTPKEACAAMAKAYPRFDWEVR